jgi:hypothetical protein
MLCGHKSHPHCHDSVTLRDNITSVYLPLYKSKGLKHNAVLHNTGINLVGRGVVQQGQMPLQNLVYLKFFLAKDLKGANKK